MASTIKKNIIYNSLYQLLIMVIPLITTPYISRTIGANGVGIYSYNYSVAQYFVLFIMLGLNNYGNRSIAEVQSDKLKLSKTFWSIYTLQLFMGAVVCLLYIIYCFTISKERTISLIMGLYVASACIDINWFFFGMEKFKLTVIRNFIIKLLTTVSIFFFIKNSSDVWKYCLILNVGIFASQVALWPMVRRYINFYRPNFREVCVHIKPNCILFLTVIAVSLYKIMDKIMLGILSTKSQVGFYESAERIISVPTGFVTAIGTVMLPRMSNMKANNDKSAYAILYKSILFAVFLSSSMSFGIMGVAKQFVPIFYGSGYDICVYLFWVLFPSCIFFAFGNVIRTQYLLPQKMDDVYVKSAFLGAIVNLIVNCILIPRLYSVGAAIGTLLAEAVVCLYQSYKVSRYVPIKQYTIKSIPFVLAGVVMFFALERFEIQGSLYFVLMIKIIIGVIIYMFILGIQDVIYYMRHKKHFFVT